MNHALLTGISNVFFVGLWECDMSELEYKRKPVSKCASTEIIMNDVVSSTQMKIGIIGRMKRRLSSLSIVQFPSSIESNSDSCSASPDENELDLSSDSSSEDEECHVTDDIKGHVNAIFKFDDDTYPPANLVKIIGCEGKQKGCFKDATDVQCFGKGKCLVTDMINGRISTFNRNGRPKIIRCSWALKEPWATTLVPENKLAVTSRKDKVVSIISMHGDILFSFGNKFFQCPCGIAVDKDGRFIVTDILSNDVSVFSPDGKWLFNLGDPQSPVQQFKCPRYVHVTDHHDIVVCDSGNHSIKVFDQNGIFKFAFGHYGREEGAFKAPYGVASDGEGNIIVADHYNDRVALFSKEGHFLRNIVTMEDGLYHPQGVALSNDMHLFVTHGKSKATEVLVYSFNVVNNEML
ncbi:tripartite motif-containing protein 2-like isoform X1 [Ostrea edulis]|uniref:tripartite motif-containing protein 2-like isoform X1 n=2 Tax=Ostrea edulis TaxID=37623 RepID=UPI0024AF42B9|nr:tripartite motif-containing protein 2-like isoform X1 [Ostrea edulis]